MAVSGHRPGNTFAARRGRQRPGYRESKPLVEFVGDQRAEGVDPLFGRGAGRVQDERRTFGGGEHHQAEDALTGDGLIAVRHRDVGGEAGGGLDEAGRCARVESQPIDDLALGAHRTVGEPLLAPHPSRVGARPGDARAPGPAWRMWSRPYATAKRASVSRSIEWRAETAFRMTGRLTPVTTSRCISRASATLTFVAESPNMSVRMSAPWPSSTDAAAAPIRSFKLSSVSSAAAPTATMLGTECPSTPSMLRSTAGASEPWPTRTMPIMGVRRRGAAPPPDSRVPRGGAPAPRRWRPSDAGRRCTRYRS